MDRQGRGRTGRWESGGQSGLGAQVRHPMCSDVNSVLLIFLVVGWCCRVGHLRRRTSAVEGISPGVTSVVVAEVCGSGLASRLMVLRGRRPVKGEPVREPCGLRPPPHGTVAARWPVARPPLTGQLPRQAWPGVEAGPAGARAGRGDHTWMSSGLLVILPVVGPGGVFVVAGSGFQAAVQDTDQPVAQLA